MKTAIFLFLMINYGYCQYIDFTKKLDTIYVKFKEDKFQKRIIHTSNYREYFFYLIKNKDSDYLNFTKPDRKNSLTEKGNTRIDKRTENKSFLEKHKTDIIGIDFFEKYGIIKSTYDAFEKCKVIYIIDCDEQKKGKIMLYRVLMSSSYRMGE